MDETYLYRERYERAGRRYKRAVESLPVDHPLVSWIRSSPTYELVDAGPSRPEWLHGMPTFFGVTMSYLFRYDEMARLASGTLNAGPQASRISALAGEVLEASRRLHKYYREQQLDDINWFKRELASREPELRSINLSTDQAHGFVFLTAISGEYFHHPDAPQEQITRDCLAWGSLEALPPAAKERFMKWARHSGALRGCKFFALLHARQAVVKLLDEYIRKEHSRRSPSLN